MKRNPVCHILFCLLFFVLPSLLWAGINPLKTIVGKSADTRPSPPAATDLTDESLNESLSKLESRIADLQLQRRSEAVAAMQRTYQSVATSKELKEWETLMMQLARTLEGHVYYLTRLKTIRKTNRNRAVEIKGWQGFAQKPPYSISLLDSLSDAIRAKQIDQQSTEIMRATFEGEVEDFANLLKRSRKEVRLAEENAEKNAGKPGELRSKWLLTVAQLVDAVNQASVVYSEARLLMAKESLEGTRAEIDFLNRKRAAVRGNCRFSEEDLDQRLQDIEGHRERLQQEVDQAVRDQERLRKQLDAGEAAIGKAKADLASRAATRVPLDRLLKEHERLQVLFDAADFRVLILRGMNRLLRNEKEIWKERYHLIAGHPAQEERAYANTGNEDLVLLSKWRDYLASQLARLQVLIKSQEEKLSSGSLPGEEIADVRSILAAYQGEEALLHRGNAVLNEYEQLANRRNEEEKAKEGGKTPAVRAHRAFAMASSLVAKIWYTELYVAEETIIAEGKKIVRPRSVTVGKLIVALVILFAGLWVIGHLKKLFRWFATKRLNAGPNDALLYGRLFAYVLFIGVLLGALIFVNIPLAVFAFFGGALAIGVGFGAQNLINNFISGLILMFDRTIRVGDIVEVDGHRGRVASIGMRSSSIKRFDGVEMLVPNSLFLQQNVINWTSSDKRTRFSIPVGVAYGSPTRETERVILKAVEDQQEVLRVPEPYVVFESFADSSLSFIAYFWIELDLSVNSLVVFSDIRHRICERLAEAGIEVPFPQRDLHVDTDKPIEIRMVLPGG